jgi:hypothetical protein
VIVAADCGDCGFNDLGKLLLGGVLAAIIAGIGVSLFLRRIKEKTPEFSRLVSIRSSVDRNRQ